MILSIKDSYDGESFNARYYNEGIGRFLTKVQYLSSDLNRYAYAGGDPVNIVDRTSYF